MASSVIVLGINFGLYAVYTLFFAVVFPEDWVENMFFVFLIHSALSIALGTTLAIISQQRTPFNKRLNEIGLTLVLIGFLMPILGVGVCTLAIDIQRLP